MECEGTFSGISSRIGSIPINICFKEVDTSIRSTSSFQKSSWLAIETKSILEIDGDYHKYQLRFDKNREAILKAYGFKIIRFANEEVEAEIDVVKAKLKEKLKGIPM